MATPQVVVMCKAPVVGRVKTRLIGGATDGSPIDAQQAAAIHRRMAEVVIRRAMRLFPGAVTIAADDPCHPFFAAFSCPLRPQGDGDLGRRMARLADAMIDRSPLLFLGTDSPHMAPERLLQAARLANNHDAVVGPVEDGGYDLILLANRNALALLQAIHWSSPQVWQQTKQRAQQANIRLASLATSFDVDTADDLARSRKLGWSA